VGLGRGCRLDRVGCVQEPDGELRQPGAADHVQNFDWHNSWYTSFGGEYYLTDQLTCAPVWRTTDPDHRPVPRAARAGRNAQAASIGIGYKASEHFQINASYEHIFVNGASINAAQSATIDVR
jgi:long-chain fatty acid transport protein